MTLVNLESADLTRANLTGAKLHDAGLSNANLTGADLGTTKVQGWRLWLTPGGEFPPESMPSHEVCWYDVSSDLS